MLKKNVVECMMMLILLASSLLQADLVGYVAGDSQIVSINFTAHESINLGPSGVQGLCALDLMPSNNDLYLTTNDGGVYNVDTVSGIATKICDTDYNGLNNISFDTSGQLFAAGSHVGGFANIDLKTGVSTTINPSPWIYTSVTAFAINSTNTGIAWDSSAEWLFEVDLSSGDTTSIGYLPGTFESFDFGPDGILYAMEPVSTSLSRLYSIDIGTRSRSGYFGDFWHENGLAIVPEPCTLILLGLGGLLAMNRQRR